MAEQLPAAELEGHLLTGFYTHQQLTNSLTWAFEEKRFLLAEEVVAIKLNPANFWWNPAVDGFLSDMRVNRDSFFAVLTPEQLEADLNFDENNILVPEYVAQGPNKWYGYKPHGWTQEKWCSITKNLRSNRHQDAAALVTLSWKEVKGDQWLRRRWFLPDDFAQVTGMAAPQPEPVILQWQRVGQLKQNRGALVAAIENVPNFMPHPLPRPRGILPARPGDDEPVGPGGYRRPPRGLNLFLAVGAGTWWGPGRGRGIGGGRGGGGGGRGAGHGAGAVPP